MTHKVRQNLRLLVHFDFVDPFRVRSAKRIYSKLVVLMSLLLADRSLLARFRLGDRRALERVYRHYVTAVTKFLRMGFTYNNSEGGAAVVPGYAARFDLENALQEVFLRAFQPGARDSYDGLRPYKSFLLGIARNVALDDMRKRLRRRESMEAVPEASAQPEPPSFAEQRIDEKTGAALVTRFLHEECADKDRTLFALRFTAELSQKATAHSARLTRIQVRRWETKFRARLLRYLKRAGYLGDS